MKKVYILRHEDLCDGKYKSGILYVFDTLEKAKAMLKEIKKDEIEELKENRDEYDNMIHDFLLEDGFIVDYLDEYTKYIVEEMEVQ